MKDEVKKKKNDDESKYNVIQWKCAVKDFIAIGNWNVSNHRITKMCSVFSVQPSAFQIWNEKSDKTWLENSVAQTNRTKSPFVLPCKQNNICITNESTNEEQSSNWKQNWKKRKIKNDKQNMYKRKWKHRKMKINKQTIIMLYGFEDSNDFKNVNNLWSGKWQAQCLR